MSSKNSNKINVPEARAAMDKFKMEAAAEVGVNLKEGYNGDLSSREAGSVGGQMVKKMIESYEKNLKLPVLSPQKPLHQSPPASPKPPLGSLGSGSVGWSPPPESPPEGSSVGVSGSMGTSGSLGSGGCQLGSLGSSPPFGSSGSVTAADVWTGHPPGLVSVGATAFSRVLMR